VPVVSSAERSTAALFAHYRTGIARDAPLVGTLDRDDLPGEIRSAYESAGVIAAPHWVLDVGADPADRTGVSLVFVALGLVLVVGGAAWAVRSARRSA
jgi:hypothetical protein